MRFTNAAKKFLEGMGFHDFSVFHFTGIPAFIIGVILYAVTGGQGFPIGAIFGLGLAKILAEVTAPRVAKKRPIGATFGIAVVIATPPIALSLLTSLPVFTDWAKLDVVLLSLLISLFIMFSTLLEKRKTNPDWAMRTDPAVRSGALIIMMLGIFLNQEGTDSGIFLLWGGIGVLAIWGVVKARSDWES